MWHKWTSDYTLRTNIDSDLCLNMVSQDVIKMTYSPSQHIRSFCSKTSLLILTFTHTSKIEKLLDLYNNNSSYVIHLVITFITRADSSVESSEVVDRSIFSVIFQALMYPLEEFMPRTFSGIKV